MKIAIPVDRDRLHPHFGGCRQFALFEVDPATQTLLAQETLPAPEHRPGVFPRWLRQHGVTVVIADGIGHRAIANFQSHAITVRAGQPGTLATDLVTAFLRGELSREPKGCDHHEHGHSHGEEHHGGHGHQHHHH
jgi:predicted Fe-Mo cluster-binding NifX family protein